jgi:hypothetical protein
MRAYIRRGIQLSRAFLMLLLGIAVIASLTLETTDNAAAATAGLGMPEIISFSAEPMVLADGAFAVYNFEVKNSTAIKLSEAGETINEFSGPSAGLYKGKANGMTTYQIRKAGMDSFEAKLVAMGPGGSQQRSLKLSFARKIQPVAGVQTPPSDVLLAKLKNPSG